MGSRSTQLLICVSLAVAQGCPKGQYDEPGKGCTSCDILCSTTPDIETCLLYCPDYNARPDLTDLIVDSGPIDVNVKVPDPLIEKPPATVAKSEKAATVTTGISTGASISIALGVLLFFVIALFVVYKVRKLLKRNGNDEPDIELDELPGPNRDEREELLDNDINNLDVLAAVDQLNVEDEILLENEGNVDADDVIPDEEDERSVNDSVAAENGVYAEDLQEVVVPQATRNVARYVQAVPIDPSEFDPSSGPQNSLDQVPGPSQPESQIATFTELSATESQLAGPDNGNTASGLDPAYLNVFTNVPVAQQNLEQQFGVNQVQFVPSPNGTTLGVNRTHIAQADDDESDQVQTTTKVRMQSEEERSEEDRESSMTAETVVPLPTEYLPSPLQEDESGLESPQDPADVPPANSESAEQEEELPFSIQVSSVEAPNEEGATGGYPYPIEATESGYQHHAINEPMSLEPYRTEVSNDMARGRETGRTRPLPDGVTTYYHPQLNDIFNTSIQPTAVDSSNEESESSEEDAS